jgi:hypothetical protein
MSRQTFPRRAVVPAAEELHDGFGHVPKQDACKDAVKIWLGNTLKRIIRITP